MNVLRKILAAVFTTLLILILVPVASVPTSHHVECSRNNCIDVEWYGSVTYLKFCFGGVYVSPLQYEVMECQFFGPSNIYS